MANQQKIRLVDCFYEPNQVFSLYDYTKIIYPVDGYICLKEITIPDSQPAFIKLEHEYDKVHALLTYPNLIVSLEQTSDKQFMLGFYDSIHLHTKLGSSLAEEYKKVYNPTVNQCLLPKRLDFKIKNSTDNIFILFSLRNQTSSFQTKQFNKSNKQTISHTGQQSQDNELIVVNAKSKRIVSRNYFSGNVKELVVKNNDVFTFLFEDYSMAEYQLYENLSGKQGFQILYMMKKSDLDFVHANPKSKHQISSHIWLKEQLIVVNQSLMEICIYVQGKKCQSISLEHVKNPKILWPLMFGFLICNENFMYVYKKMEMQYVCIAEFFIREIGFSPQLIMSPQQDILAYFMNSNKSIQYINNFCQQVENQLKTQKKHAKELKKTGSIEFKKDCALKLDVNRRNNTFALTHQSTIQLYSITNFEIYLEQSIESEQVSSSPNSKSKLKRMNTLGAVQGLIENMGKQETILKVAIHPHNELLAIALKSKVRIYQILFSELTHVKDIFVTNCSQMFYSNSGQFLSLVISGKNGSKCYVYKTSEDYELMQCLSIGKKIERFVWSKYDNYLYGVYTNGYYRWAIENRLKNRFQTLFDIPFPVVDAILNEFKDVVVLYGQNHVLQVSQTMNDNNQLNPKEIIKVCRNIKQMVYQNGSYFLNVKGQSSANFSSMIVKCEELSTLDSQLKDAFSPLPQHLAHSKQPTTYKQSTGQTHQYQMHVCSGDQKRNVIILIDEESRNIKVLEWGKNSNNQAKLQKNTDFVKIDRKNLRKIFKKYAKYEDDIKALEKNMQDTIQRLKNELMQKQKQRQNIFLAQIQVNQQKYEHIKVEKQKLEHTIEQKIEKHESKTIKQVKQLQRMYERKIAITTNKLLTSEEINYRNMLLAEQNLKKLERQANNDVQKIREEYKKQLAEYMSEKDYLAEQVYKVKKEYESRLYDLEQQNERILERYQSKTEDNQNALRKNLVSWEIKYSEALSKKDNLQKDLQQVKVSSQILKEKINYIEAKNREANKKSEYLMIDIQKYEKILQEKNTSISIYEERINDLEKSNQILKYRVIELKGETEPQSEENLKLRENLNELESEYDKIVKSAFEKEQMLSIVKKDSEKSKQTTHKLETKVKRLEKSYLDLLDKVLNITKAPIQQIRKQLINLLNSTKQDQKYLNRPTSSYARSESPLGELNRIREHLESCLHEAVDSNKKNQQQKKVELLKKNRQNSQLIKEINDLRRKVRDMEGIIKDRDLQIARLLRGDPIAVNDLKGQKENTRLHFHSSHEDETQNEEILSMNFQSSNDKPISRSQTRKQTRETKESFFDKSLFKSGQHWRQKRLKTEHSQHRNVQTRSVKRNKSGKYLQIDHGSSYEDVEDLKRMVEQKETIIKQLINKIQSLS